MDSMRAASLTQERFGMCRVFHGSVWLQGGIYGFTINLMKDKKITVAADAKSRGRPPLPEGDAMVPVMVKMKPAQKEKLQRLGGAPWVREKIDRAKLPKE